MIGIQFPTDYKILFLEPMPLRKNVWLPRYFLRRLKSTIGSNNTIESSKQELGIENIEKFTPERIRTFSIVAHIDHGKSTLADRLLELTGVVSTSSQNNQILDKLKVERERGITIKAQTASMIYNHKGSQYLLNLIDTPGHADFSYEVSRSIAACQGAVMLVDACQGIQAQTIANFDMAFNLDLNLVPVVNKIDLPSANVEKASEQILNAFELENPVLISAKTGMNVEQVLERIISDIPAPEGNASNPLRCLLFDTWYDQYAGVICLAAIKDGTIKKGDKIVSGYSKLVYDVIDLGIMHPDRVSTPSLSAGQIGYLTLNMRTVRDANIGDTFYRLGHPTEPFKGFLPARSMVFSGVFPVDNNKHNELQESIERLILTDASVSMQKETSSSLGQGFRLGFLGTLHMDVFRQRLEQEYDLEVINTHPTVPYVVVYTNKTEKLIKNLSDFPEGVELSRVRHFMEPTVIGTFVTPDQYMGKIIELCNQHRGVQLDCSYFGDNRATLKFKIPLSEILTQFYDSLKSFTSGYASFDYEDGGYEVADLVKVNILLNGKAVDSLSCVAHRSHAEKVAKSWVQKLKKVLDSKLFEIVIQGTADGKVIARETIKPTRKDVTAKCYGGDITRKMKLLNKVPCSN